ncbi:GNAT family N-acetyltransferase [Floricoccus tropicus]|uniref:GNAT family N-acetyltransferase n=1 Tax=Floricoccus tropicus TaxID=1859473 RepID=A0A1E8GS69_9LACT|nr:GNAT family N-acetyltransferase [Floricoccus tropicus]OFI50463.1 GNAT family N-acetyltransferase [Floricoccus tropicus]
MIEYKRNEKISVEAFRQVLISSGINRPVNDIPRLQAMLDNSNLIWTAWDGDRLVAVARSLTDFSFVCYMSDLAVASDYQKQGIGKKLIDKTKEDLGPTVAFLLLSAPSAMEYYPKVGLKNISNAFFTPRKD